MKGREGFQDDKNGSEFGVTVDVDEETGPFVQCFDMKITGS